MVNRHSRRGSCGCELFRWRRKDVNEAQNRTSCHCCIRSRCPKKPLKQVQFADSRVTVTQWCDARADDSWTVKLPAVHNTRSDPIVLPGERCPSSGASHLPLHFVPHIPHWPQSRPETKNRFRVWTCEKMKTYGANWRELVRAIWLRFPAGQ